MRMAATASTRARNADPPLGRWDVVVCHLGDAADVDDLSLLVL